MKKIFALLLVVLTVFALFSCGKTPEPEQEKEYVTISYYDANGALVGTQQVEKGTTPSEYSLDGYFIATELYKSADGLKAGDKDDKFDVKAALEENVNVYAAYVRNALSDGTNYTYYASFALSPSNFNPLTYKSTTDAVPLDYTTNSFYEFAYNADGTGFELVPVMAAADPEDVTGQYAALEGDPYGLKDEEGNFEAGHVFRIALNPDAKWENGDPITADDYLYTMRTLLDGRYNNYRASNYYQGGSAIYGAKDFFMSGKVGTGDAHLSYEHFSDADASKLKFVWDYKKTDKANGGTKFLNWFWNDVIVYNGLDSSFPSERFPSIVSILKALSMPVTKTEEDYAALNGKTLAEINADEGMKATLDEILGIWCEVEDETLDFFVADYTMPTYDFDHVGIKKINDYTIDIVYTSQLLGFYQKYTIGLPLVKESLYEASITQDPTTGAYSTNYGTSISTYMGYGPYKFTRYIVDQVMEFQRNENWFGYSAKYADKYGDFTREIDGQTARQYQTTNIILNYVPNISTREQMFLSGLLDVFGMNKAYLEKYGSSRRKYVSTGATAYYGIILSDYDSLVAREAVLNGIGESDFDPETYDGSDKQYNKTILTIKEFRQALCYALDRKDLVAQLYPAGSPAISLFSDLIIADPDHGTAFNSFDSTKAAICDFWGVTYGEGGDFDTLEEAYAAITGYDLTTAKELVTVAYNKAIEEGLLGANTIVKIDYCASTDSETEQLWFNTFSGWFTKLFEGTPLEGRFEYVYNTNLGSDFGGAIQSGKADTSWGFGWSGGELDPYDLFQVYVDAAAGGDEPYQYDMWLDRSDRDNYTIELDLDVDGDGTAEHYSYTCYEWYLILNGQDDELPNWRFGKVADAIRAEVLAAMEKCVLNDYTTIPLMNQGSTQLLSYKVNYGKESFMFGMGFGGLRYMTYNYNDHEWNEYVKSQNGTLEYK